jgi:putative transposase
MGRSRYRFQDPDTPHFLTCTALEWFPLFAYPANTQVLLDSFTHLQQQGRLTLYGYVILENHCHLLAASPELPRALASFKSFTARQIIRHLQDCRSPWLDLLAFHKARHKRDRDHQVWQEGSHPKQVQDETMMLQKLEYIHNNPVTRGYVDDPVHWRYSSARNYAGMPGLIDVSMDW